MNREVAVAILAYIKYLMCTIGDFSHDHSALKLLTFLLRVVSGCLDPKTYPDKQQP